MDLARMLQRCRRDQWSVDDLDWSARPREFSRADEEAIVQLFTDMAGIERLAGALFAEQQRRVTDPVLREIFGTFILDEERHAQAAERLAAFYDVHRYRAYQLSPNLVSFRRHFLRAVVHLSDDVANMYITGGELILDIALLRSLNDHVADEMSEAAMALINRDESRHIAIDYHMVGHYASPAYLEELSRRPPPALRERVHAWYTFAGLLYHAAPFFRDVFFEPMVRLDPSGRRMREAFKRMQLLTSQKGIDNTAFGRLQVLLLQISNHRLAGPLLRRAAARVAGVPPEFMRTLYTPDELQRARRSDFEALAQEALGAKLAS